MTSFSLYPHIKYLHQIAAAGSGVFFLVRALALLGGMRWPRAAPVRYLSYAVDTVLLACALALVHILPQAAFANGWLWVKLALVLTYIVLGIAAFRSQRRARRATLIALSALCFLQVYAIARTHHPLGWMIFIV